LDALFAYKQRKARAKPTTGENAPQIRPFSTDRKSRSRRDWTLHPPTALDMNRRYAYRDYEILVSAQPAGSLPGWRPEICVIAPDDHWQFVPTHHSLVANDPQYCLEIGRRCAESAIQSMDPAREIAAYEGHWH
jgi:hypothetical protein